MQRSAGYLITNWVVRGTFGEEMAVVEAVVWDKEKRLVLRHYDLFRVDVLALERGRGDSTFEQERAQNSTLTCRDKL